MYRDELIAKFQETADERPRAVEVKKWGTLYVRYPKVSEYNRYSKAMAEGNDDKALAMMAAQLLCDPDGNLIFDANEPGHVDLLMRQPLRLLMKAIREDEEGN